MSKLPVIVSSIIMFLMVFTVSAQQETVEGNGYLAFMIGEWQVESQRNLPAYLSQEPVPGADWEMSEGVASIESLMHDTSLLERYVSTEDEQVYEQTFFLATRNDGRQWDASSTDNFFNALIYLHGNF